MAEGPSTCGCRSKCSVEIPYFDQKIKTYSPKIAALIRTITVKWERLNKYDVLIWAQKTQFDPEIEHKIQAIRDFSMCPNILEFAGKFENWNEAVAEIREDLKNAQNQKVFTIFVRTLDEEKLEFHVKQSDTVKSLKFQIENRQGMPTMLQRLIFDGRQTNDDKSLGYLKLDADSDILLLPKQLGGEKCQH
ncbi:unnamed protein product [Caenorhabditis angaria]|uniref:Ubiquitin-like domain-containing protein n=1 Tax=Caenorhabditis angaria TaxID=860376 RepID=A0A9P1J2J3_9PELO|nr:unnamed protein product [Caenorhabditis angaria]